MVIHIVLVEVHSCCIIDSSDKEIVMIRAILGFLMVFGAVGGMDNATDAQLIPLMLTAIIGLTLMYFGVEKINRLN